jgi:lambda repressor-like predicted transcriptional regulator
LLVDLFAVCASICSEQFDRLCERTTRELPKGSPNTQLVRYLPNVRLSAFESGNIANRFEAGETITALALEYKVHRCTIQNHLDRHGVKRSAPVPILTTADITKAAELYATGFSTAEVGQKMGVNAKTISNHLKRAGYEVRRRRGWGLEDKSEVI